MRSVVNTLFFKKIKIYKGFRCEKKEVDGPNCFLVGGFLGNFLERLEKKIPMQHTKTTVPIIPYIICHHSEQSFD
jgi:predicted hydrocarbon binding protein